MNKEKISLETIVSFCKQRGFIFPGSEIYGGQAGTYDYGPLGVMLRRNIMNSWLKTFVTSKRNVFEVDASIIMNPKTWQATGHVDGFVDPLVEDLKTNKRYRADHLLEDHDIDPLGMAEDQMSEKIKKLGIKSPEGNELSNVKTFNLMFTTHTGPVNDSANVAYLRPETAQGIFVNYKNIINTMRPKLPFGVAQIGKAFRNEITPRDFVFRSREFNQMEIEYFVHPDEWQEFFETKANEIDAWLEKTGLNMDLVHREEISAEDRAHYSDRTIDFEFDFPFGKKELLGLAYRTDHDLKSHQDLSGQKLQYTDPYTNETFVPHVIEPSFGVERLFLALLVSVYVQEEERVVLKLPKHLAPYRVAVSPLLKNKPDLVIGAQKVFEELQTSVDSVAWDDHGNIGKRYRRQDEIGTPCCVVFDFDSLDDGCVTVRDRDSQKQERVKIEDLVSYLK